MGLNECLRDIDGARGKVVSSASDGLGNPRQFAFGRVKSFRKSPFFPLLRLGSVYSVGFPWQIKIAPKNPCSAEF